MAETLRLSPVICAYPDDKYENYLIEVVLPGSTRKIFLLTLLKTVFMWLLVKKEFSI
jgi:hypothetical protein